MKYFLVLCAVFFCWISVSAGSIKCYFCVGTGDGCATDKLVADKAKYLVKCHLCMTYTYRVKTDDETAVMKLCSVKSDCDATKKQCDKINDMTDGQCVVDCCDTDECNAVTPRLPNSK
ncbi:uncharacterized protein LOC144638552 [Oculina patagonica]